MNVQRLILGISFASALLMGCGGGGGSTSNGNSISGSVSVSSSTMRTANLRAISALAYDGLTVSLLDSSGATVATTTTAVDGSFSFSNVAQGDYTVVFADPQTGGEVTRVTVALLDGDDVNISGEISTQGANWTVNFTSNTSNLQNETQQAIAGNLAAASGSSLSEVTTMRESGMGWGEIAKELGVHPSELGLGHNGDDSGFDMDKHSEAHGENMGSSHKPDDAGNSDDHGKPDDAGQPEDPSNPGHGNPHN